MKNFQSHFTLWLDQSWDLMLDLLLDLMLDPWLDLKCGGWLAFVLEQFSDRQLDIVKNCPSVKALPLNQQKRYQMSGSDLIWHKGLIPLPDKVSTASFRVGPLNPT